MFDAERLNPSTRRLLRPGRVLAALGLLALACTCSRDAGSPATALAELERLAFVGSGRAVLSGDHTCGVEQPLLVDRFEVTRGLWREVAGRWPGRGLLSQDVASSNAERRDWPAYADFGEAQSWAEKRGMRLPSFDEWLYFAAGPTGGFYPWGRQNRASVANTRELGLGRPLSVGCFEQGATARELYDLFGNVSEWVTGLAPVGAGPISLLGQEESAYSMGGSYLDYTRPLHLAAPGPFAVELVRFAMRPLHRETRGVELGLRCCVEAEAYLETNCRDIEVEGDVAARLRSIGSGWGSESRATLERLLSRHPDSESLLLLLEGARAAR